MDQYITYYSSEFHDSSDPRNTATSNGSGSSTSPTPHQPPSNPITLNWTPTPSGPPDLEEPNSLCMYPHLVNLTFKLVAPINQPTSPGVFEDGYLRDPGFDLAALPANLNNLHTVLAAIFNECRGTEYRLRFFSCRQGRHQRPWFLARMAYGRIQWVAIHCYSVVNDLLTFRLEVSTSIGGSDEAVTSSDPRF